MLAIGWLVTVLAPVSTRYTWSELYNRLSSPLSLNSRYFFWKVWNTQPLCSGNLCKLSCCMPDLWTHALIPFVRNLCLLHLSVLVFIGESICAFVVVLFTRHFTLQSESLQTPQVVKIGTELKCSVEKSKNWRRNLVMQAHSNQVYYLFNTFM